MDIKQIQDLIRFVSKSGVNEVSIEQKDFKITIKTNQAPTYVNGKHTGTASYTNAGPCCSRCRHQLLLSCRDYLLPLPQVADTFKIIFITIKSPMR